MLGRTSLYRERQQRVTFLIKVRIVPKQELCNFFFNTRMFHHVYHGPTALHRSSQHEKTPVTRDTVTAPSTLIQSQQPKKDNDAQSGMWWFCITSMYGWESRTSDGVYFLTQLSIGTCSIGFYVGG